MAAAIKSYIRPIACIPPLCYPYIKSAHPERHRIDRSRRKSCLRREPGFLDRQGGRSLSGPRNPKARTPRLKYGHRWLFIGLTLHANREDAAPVVDDAAEPRLEVISSIPATVEPPYYQAVKDASARYAVDPNLIATIIYVESGGDVRAVSQKGAKGLMQLTPAVYRQYVIGDPFDIEQNIFGGTAYLAYLLRRFDGNLEQALAAYNCGPTRVIEYGGIPPIRETREYVDQIMEYYLSEGGGSYRLHQPGVMTKRRSGKPRSLNRTGPLP